MSAICRNAVLRENFAQEELAMKKRMLLKRMLLSIVMCLTMALGLVMPAWAADDMVSPAAHDMEYKTELVSSQSLPKQEIGFAKGQNANGTTFSSSGGFYWTDGGNLVDVSLSVSWGVASVSISAGSVGGTGMFITAPANTPCKLFIYKDLVVKRYKEYERLSGTATWNFIGYKTGVEEVGTHLEVRYGTNFSKVWNG